jgi:HEAT repeat protein
MARPDDEWIDSVMADRRSPQSWLKLLTSEDADEQHRAKYKLGSLTPDDDHFFRVLTGGVRAPDQRVRLMSLVGLKCLGQFPPELVAVVKGALSDPVQAVRQAGLGIVSDFDVFDDDLVQLVVRLLQSDPDKWVRRDAASTAGALARKGAATLPNLIAATHDDDTSVRRGAVIAIKLLGPIGVAAASRMWELLRYDADEGVRNQAEAALRLTGAIHC